MEQKYSFLLLIALILVAYFVHTDKLKERIADCQQLIYDANTEISRLNSAIISAQGYQKLSIINDLSYGKSVDSLLGQNLCFKGNEAVERLPGKSGEQPILNQVK